MQQVTRTTTNRNSARRAELSIATQEYTRGIFDRLFRLWMTPWWLPAYRPAQQAIAALPTPPSAVAATRPQQQPAVSQAGRKVAAPAAKRAAASPKRRTAKAAAPARKRATSKTRRVKKRARA